MKKRTYRATNVKQANWEKIAGLAAGQPVVWNYGDTLLFTLFSC